MAGYAKTILPIFAFVLVAYLPTGLAKQEFLEQPQNITVQRGESVTFPCKVKNSKGAVQWTKEGFGLGTDRELMSYPRYMMIGSNESGNYSLHISTVLLVDEGEYQCQVGGAEGEEPLRSRIVKLTVLYPPKNDNEHVSMQPASPLKAIAGSTVRITCRGGLTKPTSNITWYKGDEKITTGVENAVETLSSSVMKSSTSWVQLDVDDTYHHANISCHVEHPALEEPIVRSLIMLVQYPPTVTVSAHFIKAKEGDTLKFTCTAEGNPKVFRYRWEMNSIAIGDTSELILPQVTRKDNAAKVSCLVTNNIGTNEGSTTLNVEYEPLFTEEPKDVDDEDGQDVSLQCLVDSNPKSEIVWTHDNSNKVIGHGSKWVVKVSKETVGTYRCRAAAPGYAEVSRTVMLFRRGTPRVTPNQLMYGRAGEQITVPCLIESIPRPTQVLWSKDGVPIDTGSMKYKEREEITRSGIHQRLVIQNAQTSDFGFYNCTAINDFGIDSKMVEIKMQAAMSMVTIFVSIVGLTILALVVIGLTVLFRRPVNKYADSSMDKQSVKSTDQSSTEDSVIKDSRSGTVSDFSHSEEVSLGDWETNDNTSVSPRISNRRPRESYRFSGDFSEPIFPPKTQNDGDYISSYVGYNNDYMPPPQPALASSYARNTLYASQNVNVDPRYSAAYGNPYLKVPPNARSVNYANADSFDSLGCQSPQNNNLNKLNIGNKNAIYNPIGQRRNDLGSSHPSQYVVLPQSDGQNIQGTQI